MLSAEQCAQFHRDGFLHLRGVFGDADIERLEQAAATLPMAPSATRYFYDVPGLEDFWSDERLTSVARSLLGSPVVYSFDGVFVRYDFNQGTPDMARHLHHDAKGTSNNIFNRVNDALSTTYPALRFAIYLQDTKSQSGGLKIGVGTHRMDVSSFEGRDLKLFNVETIPGDLVIFTHRLLHSPLALRLKNDPQRALTPAEEDEWFERSPGDFLPIPTVRDAIFIDYLSTGEEADLYLKNRALMASDKSARLAQVLADEQYLDKLEDSPLLLRVDRAIVETCEAIKAHGIENGTLNAVGETLVMRLPRLCRAHFETSDFHLLHDSEVADNMPVTALRLFNEIYPRIRGLRRQLPSRQIDVHMGPTPTALARRKAADFAGSLIDTTPTAERSYNLARWQDFHRMRRLSCPTKPILRADTRIFTMGSCFAMQIRRAMAQRGLTVYPNYAAVEYDRSREIFAKIPERETLAHYDTFSMRQEFEAALGQWPDRAMGYWPVERAPVNKMLDSPTTYQDPYRKMVYATTLPALTSLADRVTASIRDGLEACDVLVLTLGLTEVWQHKTTGRHICRPPGSGYGGGAGMAVFRQSTFAENYENMRVLLDLFFARYPDKHVIISVSPVALEATASMYDVGTANNESKAILRAVAGQISREYANITYFPSYEMATVLGMDVYDDDGRHVKQAFADRIVQTFVTSMSA